MLKIRFILYIPLEMEIFGVADDSLDWLLDRMADVCSET
jgi:hypothetical protein